MKHSRGQEGFTLIELVIIILVLGILAATAIPRFYDMRAAANAAAEKGVVGGVRGGIAIIYASNVLNSPAGTFPAELDGYATGVSSPTRILFSNVLSPGMDDGSWTKTGTYTYTGPVGTKTYTYDSTTGTFQ